jgi:hypothetical protein
MSIQRQTMRLFFILLVFFGLAVNPAFSQDKPEIRKLWSLFSGEKQGRVFQIMDDSVRIFNDDPTKLTKKSIKIFKIQTLVMGADNKMGRMIYTYDSLNLPFYRVVDFANLTIDSLSIFEHGKVFEGLPEAKSTAQAKAGEGRMFYTTEYLYYLKLDRSAPEMKKEDYLKFLASVSEELKKPDVKAKAATIPGNTTEAKITNYFKARIKEAPYTGKIFPSSLMKAMKKYEKDKTVKKQMTSIRPIFFVKPPDPKQAAAAKPADSKATGTKTPGAASKPSNPPPAPKK